MDNLEKSNINLASSNLGLMRDSIGISLSKDKLSLLGIADNNMIGVVCSTNNIPGMV